MKFRIVECKYDGGELYYKIQVKRLFSWKDYGVDYQVYSTLFFTNSIETVAYRFWTPKSAEKALNHLREIKKYRGKMLYPCVLENGELGYYCPWLSDESINGNDYKIIGSEEHCKKDIDYWIERLDNLSYCKVSKEIDL